VIIKRDIKYQSYTLTEPTSPLLTLNKNKYHLFDSVFSSV